MQSEEITKEGWKHPLPLSTTSTPPPKKKKWNGRQSFMQNCQLINLYANLETCRAVQNSERRLKTACVRISL